MAYLVDTNVLLRFADRADPQHPIARHAVAQLQREHSLLTTGQNLVEFWNVITRPIDRNGFGKTPADAEPLLALTEQLFPRLPDPPDAYERWRELVVRFGVSGVKVHDTRLVVSMLANDMMHILTFNGDDFRRYEVVGIRAVEPKDI
ncbi:MAG: PIN domain-containing protein [Thermoanaerobaculia bacterium]|nr:PIN domain-containing protein [Thermoanaerobaculia bacterium]